jgi:hypothetical protein
MEHARSWHPPARAAAFIKPIISTTSRTTALQKCFTHIDLSCIFLIFKRGPMNTSQSITFVGSVTDEWVTHYDSLVIKLNALGINEDKASNEKWLKNHIYKYKSKMDEFEYVEIISLINYLHSVRIKK